MGNETEEGLENARLVGHWAEQDCRLHEAVRCTRARELRAAGVSRLLAAELQSESALGLPASSEREGVPEGYQLERPTPAGLLESGDDEAAEWLRRHGMGQEEGR